MLNPKKKISKKELKQDTLISGYVEITSYYEKYKKQINQALLGLVLISIVTVVYVNNRRSNNEKASSELSKIMSIYDNAVNDFTQYQTAINGPADGHIMGLKAIVDNYGNSDAGELARFYLANAYFNSGKIEEALTQFDKFSSDDKLLRASAFAGMASCYEAKKEFGKAASYYEKASNLISNTINTPSYLHHAGRCYGLAGEKEKAVSLYKRLKKEFPNSSFGRDADRYIAQFAV